MSAMETTSYSERALPRFRLHSRSLQSRSDRRALWMVCVGVAACEADASRRSAAAALARRWIEEQPSRVTLFEDWLRLLRSQEELEGILEPTSHNQQLRSVSPLAASIRPKEHREALVFFQKNLAGS